MSVRRATLGVAALAAIAGAAAYLPALPAVWRMAWPYALLFGALGAAQVVTVGAALARHTRRRLLLAAGAAFAVVVLWALVRLAGALPEPDPWLPVDSAIGFADDVCAGLEAAAALLLCWAALADLRPRLLAAAALVPLAPLVLLGAVVGVAAGTNGFAGPSFPYDPVAPSDLPAGVMSTLEYCRPDGVPLAMDLYMPASAPRPAPLALYVHGGGLLGNRMARGLGAMLANNDGALFGALQRELNARGFVVAAIDYRLPPAAPWPAPIVDAKCAVRFLRAHAADLGVDPTRIGTWGSSGGGQLVSLLGLAGPGAGFDRSEYPDQSSAVQAVVDMFGPADLNDFDDTTAFGRFVVQLYVGGSTAVRRGASPATYVAPGAPPFLIVQGLDDTMVLPRQSRQLAERLRAAGVPAALVEVEGTGHTLSTPGERPSAQELTARVADFFATTLR